MIKVLQLVGGGPAIGGVEKMLLNYYGYMDRSKVRFDFCFYRRSTLVASHTEFSELLNDAHVYDLHLFEGTGKFLGYLKAIPKVKKLIKENKYDIVHINAGRPPLLISGLISATLAGAKVRITHSHSTKGQSGRSKYADLAYSLVFSFIRPFFRTFSTHMAACSTEAAKYMFGNNIVNSPKYIPIHNAIIVDPYLFNNEIRDNIREEIGAQKNTLVLGHIGSFSRPKNHLFLIDIFSSIKKQRDDVVLWLAGGGALRPEVETKVKECGLEKSVVFLGERNDVNRLYQGLDALIFPSLWEGLSVTLVEAQASALPIFTSTNISPEHGITDFIRFIDLNKGASYWADYIMAELPTFAERPDMAKQIAKSGYDIKEEAQQLLKFYEQTLKQ